MKVEKIETLKDFSRIKSRWVNLYERSNSDILFLTWEWILIWIKTLGVNESWGILLISENNDDLAAFAYIERKGSVQFIGSDKLSDYMDILCISGYEELTIKAVLNFFQSSDVKKIILKRIPDGEKKSKLYAETAHTLGMYSIVSINCLSPTVDMKVNWDTFLKSRSKKLRQDMRTTYNNLSKLGEVSFELINAGNRKPLLKILEEFHKDRQTTKVGKSLFDSYDVKSFLLKILDKEWVSLSCMKIDNKIVSIVLGFEFQNKYYYWIPSFDSSFIKYSLGKLHLKYLMELYFDKGFDRFDMLIGVEPYKKKWSMNETPNYEVILFVNRIEKNIHQLKVLLRKILKGYLGKFPTVKLIWREYTKRNSYIGLVKKLLAYQWVKIPKVNTAPILCYHSINENYDKHVDPMSPGLFERHVKFLTENYNILSLMEYITYIKAGDKFPDNSVVITFDDGYQDNFNVLFPILKKYEMPVSIFLVTGYIDGSVQLEGAENWQGMTWDEIREMNEFEYITFGSHTDSHRLMGSLNMDEITQEIKVSIEKFQQNLNEKCKLFAFPNGQGKDIPKFAISILERMSISGSCSTLWRASNSQKDLFTLKRIMIKSSDDVVNLELKLKGGYDYLYFWHKIRSFISNIRSRGYTIR
jgi:peptidoglycan/xylan/chitin deacetylase (PgdA/CDA1 family)/CelD/BcsL family acetyltransferase involved in cellulose biosynthesis